MTHNDAGSLAGRVGVVTGASAGIGAAIARARASRGARRGINARRADRLESLRDDLSRNTPGSAPNAVTVPGDASDPGVVDAMLGAAKDAFGAEADLVVVNAGRGLAGSPVTSDDAQWEEMVRINLTGAARLMRTSASRMLADIERAGEPWPRRARDIVVISSNVGKHISPFSSMYGSTKFAITSIAEAMRRELAPTGVRVSAIHPGVVRSEFQGVAGYDPEKFGAFMDSIGPVLEPADVAETIAFIVSRPAHVHVNDVILRPTRQDYP